MAAGLGFKTFTTGEVLTAADTNGYLMQGVLVFASSAARASAITSPQEGQYSYLKDTNSTEYYDGAAWIAAPIGDITGVTAGTGISGGGTSGTVTVTNSMATEITAAGDIIVGTGSGTFDNLPIGTTAQVLTADTTVSPYKVKWATPSGGDMTLVTSAAFSSVTSVSLPNSTFTTANNVYVIYFILTAGTGAQTIRIRRRTGGTDTTNASYFTNGFKAQGGATTYITNPSETSWNTFMTTSSPEYQNGNQITIYQPMTQNNGHMSMNGITDNYAAAIVSGGYNGTGVTFDALTWFIPSGTMSGRYSVFKMTN